jgi:hypothetical protein
LRGKTLSEMSFHRDETPYRLRSEERGKSPDKLLEYAIFEMLKMMIADYAKRVEATGDDDLKDKLKFLREFRRRVTDHEILPAATWMKFVTNEYEFAGVPLRNIGFWNVLKHFLSSEAFLLVHDGFGFLSVISNWNAPEAFKWLLTDFSPHQRLQTIPGGLYEIVKGLEAKLKGRVSLETGHRLKALHWKGARSAGFRLRFNVGEEERETIADQVVLAMPPSALGRIRLFERNRELSVVAERNWQRLIHCSRPHRLAKIVLAYEEPWWQQTRIPGAESGRLFTDLPMRQIHYFGPKWLAENKWTTTREAARFSLIMVYNDSHYEAFWRTFNVHEKVYRAQGDATEEEDTLGRRPQSIADGPFGFWGPHKMRLLHAAANASAEQREDINDDKTVDIYEVRHRMEEKVREQLAELHEYDVPMAIGGVYKDWSDDGGWHTWEPFVDVPRVKRVIIQPFQEHSSGLAVCPLTDEDVDETRRVPLYVCGEAYAWEQGWIEGALMTAERVAATISGDRDECRTPPWFTENRKDAFYRHMYAELSRKKQAELPVDEK